MYIFNLFLMSLKWNEWDFEIFSNIKLIILKNTLYCPLYGTTHKKNLSCLVRPQKNRKIGDSDRCNIAYHMRKIQTIYSIFFEPKNFKLTVYLHIEF
jgi:hypothetical protein